LQDETSNATGPLADAFAAEGALSVVGGNTPFLLDDPQAVWLLERGKIEIFAVARGDDGQATGPRRHYFSLFPGELLFGMDLDAHGEGLGLLAVGVVGTRIRKLGLSRFKQITAAETTAAQARAAIERWVSGLSEGAARTVVPRPRADVLLEAGQTQRVGDGKRTRPREGVLWYRQLSGGSVFLGMEEPAELPQGGVFPVAFQGWLQAIGKSQVAAIDTAAAVADGSAWPGLVSLHATVFRCEFFNSRLATVDELNRLRDKAARDQRAAETSLKLIANVLAEGPQLEPPIVTDDHLLAAVALVGAHLRIKVVPPPKSKGDETIPVDPLQEIVRASRIRMRRVLLKDDWWKQDGGPFLAYWEEGQKPIALLPDSPQSYVAYDAETGVRQPVGAELVARIAPHAWTFYRPFGDRKLAKPLDLFKFALESCRQDVYLPLLVGVGAGILGMATPYFMGMLVDEVIPEASRNQLVQLAIILAVVGVVSALFDTVRSLSLLRIEARMSSLVQPAMWDRLLGLPVSFFRRYSSGDLAQRASGIDGIRRILSGVTMAALMNAMFSLFNYGLLFWYSWELALVATGVMLLALPVTLFAAWRKVGLQRDVMEVEGKIAGLVLQLLVGISKLRVAGAERRAFSEWARKFSDQKTLGLRTGRVDNAVEVFNSGFPLVSSLTLFYGLLWITAEALKKGLTPLSPGDFIGFNSAFGIFLSETLQMATALMTAMTVVPVFERARPILAEKAEVDASKLDPGELTGRIEVDRVTFRYHPDGPAILQDVTVHIEPGEFIAIVGPSGSGKSTLLRMMLGLEVPEAGGVYFDGRDVQMLDVQKLRRRIGVVTQNAGIRAGSIFANIVGSLPLSVDDAWAAAKMAGFEEDVKAMPMGMHTVLTQGGLTLSGGQRQRLMISRAIVTRPRILFFDEATSALDNRTQAIVSRSLQELQTTRVVIAHRLTTIMHADRIYVMQDGKLVQQGAYQALAGQPGLFQDLIKRQVA